jgi:hypothetical protein
VGKLVLLDRQFDIENAPSLRIEYRRKALAKPPGACKEVDNRDGHCELAQKVSRKEPNILIGGRIYNKLAVEKCIEKLATSFRC